jgi:hypothetical protein
MKTTKNSLKRVNEIKENIGRFSLIYDYGYVDKGEFVKKVSLIMILTVCLLYS